MIAIAVHKRVSARIAAALLPASRLDASGVIF
jgi:hypothetical protein